VDQFTELQRRRSRRHRLAGGHFGGGDVGDDDDESIGNDGQHLVTRLKAQLGISTTGGTGAITSGRLRS
jgi:hypothetical protein